MSCLTSTPPPLMMILALLVILLVGWSQPAAALNAGRHAAPAAAAAAAAPPSSPTLGTPTPTGVITDVHDPSGATYDPVSKNYYLFGTGQVTGVLLTSHVSTDSFTWSSSAPVFTQDPAWTKNISTHVITNFWAPDIINLNGLWHLYYAVSTFGSQNSCIAVVVNPQLDPNHPDFKWVDQGPVICSTQASLYNTIDPHVFIDAATGKVWMNLGSYWSGIFVVELAASGSVYSKLVGTPTNIARDPVAGEVIEASWIQPHPVNKNELFLFVNYGVCCNPNSTYRVYTGVSRSGPLGPYVSKAGRSMVSGAGELLMGNEGRCIGPGQIGFSNAPAGMGPNLNISAPIITYHFYDAQANPRGLHTLGLATLIWGDWPTVVDRQP